jgi:hypothetical protein
MGDQGPVFEARFRGPGVIEYVDALKDTYYWMRSIVDGRAVGRNPRWDAAFAQIAAFLQTHNLSPKEYVLWCYPSLQRKCGRVYPNMLSSPYLLNEFKEGEAQRREELELILKLQAQTVETLIERGYTLDQILLDERLELSALFRYAVAINRGRSDLAPHFREEALELLSLKPYYKELLRRWLPREVLDGAVPYQEREPGGHRYAHVSHPALSSGSVSSIGQA